MSCRRIKKEQLVPISLETVLRIAGIVGPMSAAAMALRELYARQSAGESVALFAGDGCFIVGPVGKMEETR